jgi:uncharacterized membrane protein
MSMLVAAALVFLGIHFLISGTKARDAITAITGEGPYLGLFSLASLVSIAWLAISYNRAEASDENRVLYDLGIGVRHAAIPVIAIAFFLGVQGLFMPNPTSVRGESLAGKNISIQGVLRITRHPFLWGAAIWAAFHTTANGDLASVIFFGTFLVLSIFGTLLIDAKRKRKMGAAWDAFAAKTSNLPFAAIVSGRNRLRVGELFGWRFWAAAGIFLIVLFAHARLFGASPFPTGWVPF